jgi:predicted AlkP superfamily pyrophosphatase or phosphodiesterase
MIQGLYPESHGIVSNNMYDEEIDKIFSLSAFTAKDSRWWKGEPVNETALLKRKK